MDREYYTRNCALSRIPKDILSDKSLILSSDLDEIVSDEVLSFCKTQDLSYGRSLEMDFYYYNCNWKFINPWSLAKIITYSSLISKYDCSLQKLRGADLKKIKNAGWHLSYFLTYDQIALKLRSFSHSEYSGDKYTSLPNIKLAVTTGKDLFGRNFILERSRNKLPKNISLLLKMYQRDYINNAITIFYGTESNSIEVTDKAISLFYINNGLRIPEQRNLNDYFGDPCPNIYKHLYIIANNKIITIPENNNEYQIMLNKKPTQKCIYYLCEIKGMNCFEDYVNSLGIVDVKIFYSDEKHIKYLNLKENVYIFRYNVPGFISATDNIFVLNTEQMIENNRYQRLVNNIKLGHQIIDYSLTNLEILNLGTRGFYLPYQHNIIESSKLNEYCKYEKYDIAMVGEKTKRRMDIYNKLKEKYDVLYVEGWDEIRDQQIGMCKILLNIHVDEQFQIFEHICCDRWIFAGKLVLSEYSQSVNNLDISNLVIWSHYDDIVNIIPKLLAVGNLDVPNEVSKITEMRSNMLSKFVEHMNLNII